MTPCEVCAKEMGPHKGAGRPRRFCSYTCWRKSRGHNVKPSHTFCKHCATEIQQGGRGRIRDFCGNACWREWRKSNAPRCSIDDCDRPRVAHGLCMGHYVRILRGSDVPLFSPLRDAQ